MTTYTDVFGSETLPPAEYGYKQLTITADTTLVWPYNSDGSTSVAKVMDVSCGSGNILTLPDATLVSTGEDFLVRNVGANTLSVNNAAGVLVGTVSASTAKYFYLTDNTTTGGVYGEIAFGTGTSAVDAASLIGYGIKAVGSSLNQSHPVVTLASSLTVDSTHRSKLLAFIGGDVTFTLTDVATLGDDFFFMVRNAGTGTLTIDPAGSELIDGQLTLTVQPSESLIVFCSGIAWYSVGYGRSITYQFSQLVKDVSAGGTITLTSSEASNKLLTFTGSPASNLNVVVPSVVAVYYVYCNISTPYSVTVKTSAGTGSAVAQTQRSIVMCDGTNVQSAMSVFSNTTISVADGSAALPALNFVSQTNTGLAKFGTQGLGVSVNGTFVAEFEASRALLRQPLDYIRNKLNPTAPLTSEGTLYYDSTLHALVFYNNVGAMTVGTGDVTSAQLALKSNIASPVFTGNPTAPTPTAGDNDTSIATTAFAMNMQSPAFVGTPTVPTATAGTSTTQAASTAFAMNMQSPAFVGTPTAPTATPGTNTTQLATTAFAVQLAFQAALPVQTGNSGKFITTDGSTASWDYPPTLPIFMLGVI